MAPFEQLVQKLFPGAQALRTWPIRGGVSTTTTGIELRRPDGSLEQVVVREQSGAGFKEGVATSQLEHALLTTLAAEGLPVPRPLHVDDTRTLLPSPFVVYPFVEGSTQPPEPTQMADAMAELLARVHALDVAQLPGGLPARHSPLEDLEHWVDAELLELAGHHWAGGRPAVLLHGDYWPGNLHWAGSEIVGLFDWEDAAVGDHLSDLACARAELFCAAGQATMDRFTQQYFAGAGSPDDDLAVWDVYVSASALATMDDWGLAPAPLEARRRSTQAFLVAARQTLQRRLAGGA